MSEDSSKKKFEWLGGFFGYSLLLVVAFYLSQALTIPIVQLTKFVGNPLALMDETLANTVVSLIFYGIMLAIVVLVPRLAFSKPVDKNFLGLQKNSRFKDLGIAALGFIVYMILGNLLLSIAAASFPDFNLTQEQDLGFSTPTTPLELALMFVLFVVVAPVFEELVFRGALQGGLINAKVPLIIRVLVVSVLFGWAHQQWNVGINVFALSIVLCLAREYTKTIWAGIFLHMIKNGIAFLLLYQVAITAILR